MPLDIDPARLALVVGWTILMAVLGTVLAGNAVRTWYPTLAKGRIEIPIGLFAVVGLACYVFEAIVGYRLLERLESSPTAGLVLFALVVVMVYNELWNAALFRLRSPFAALIALLGFLAPLAILVVGCALVDTPSLVLVGVYAVWVIGYDVPWIHGLWRANAPTGESPVT
ncbi:MAG: TspO/MBR family protein [Chloroflexota bacterium]